MPLPVELSPWQLEWSDALSVNIPEIDAEHQHFIHLINQLNEAIIARMELEEIKRRMQAILDDATAHFSHEEDLFREWGYPEAAYHTNQHTRTLRLLREIMGLIQCGGVEYEWIAAGLKVKQALIDHLLTEDMKYRDYRSALSSV